MDEPVYEYKQLDSAGPVPVVSILMPAYNVRAFIREAIDSILRQSFRDWELLVVDDGSTDGTFDEARRAAGDDPRVICIQSLGNEGIGQARARALALARGRLVALMDSDDVAEESWLGTRVRQLRESPDLVAVSGSRRLIDEEGRPLGRTREALSSDALGWGLLFGNPFCQPSSVLRTEAVIRAGGYGRERFLEDWSLFARLSRMGRLLQTSDLLVAYRVRSRGASHTVGSDRRMLEDMVAEILGVNLRDLVEAPVPAALAWTLFRGRQPAGGTGSVARRAVAIVLEALRRFADGRRIADRPGVAAGALVDVANVLRCGGWSPSLALSSIRGVVEALGVGVVVNRRVAREILAVLAIPLTRARGRRRRA